MEVAKRVWESLIFSASVLVILQKAAPEGLVREIVLSVSAQEQIVWNQPIPCHEAFS